MTRLAARIAPAAATQPDKPRSIFVLRNNDIGDLLVVTPLFEALKRRFPGARIAAGVGSWNAEVLKNNPFVDEVLEVNAPWHNQRVQPQGPAAALRYIASSPEMRAVRERRFDIGIDVLGSAFGSLLLMQAGIPWRLGVKGYAGGHSGVQQHVRFDENEHVGRSALRFAELLGARELPENRPRIFLDGPAPPCAQIVLAPGGGFAEKRWPLKNFTALARSLAAHPLAVIGGAQDAAAGDEIAAAHPNARNFAGTLSLRQTFELIARARLVVCNSSMAMHAAAAFRRPCVVVLGGFYDSARQHAAQWAYPETRVLGRDAGRPAIYTPGEVLDVIAADFSSGEITAR